MSDDVDSICCTQCGGQITTMEKLECFCCKNKFHIGCTPATRTQSKLFMEMEYAAYICKDCCEKEFVPKEELMRCMNENDALKKKCESNDVKIDDKTEKKKCDDVVRVSEMSELKNDLNEMKKSMKDFMKDIVQLLRKDSVGSVQESRRQTIRSQIFSTSNGHKKRKVTEIYGEDDDVFIPENKKLYSDAVKKNLITVKINTKTEDQKGYETKADIEKCVEDPSSIVMTGIRSRRNGNIEVDCGCKEGADKLMKEVQEKFGDKYEIKVDGPRKPQIKVIGFTKDYNNEELIDRIKIQNKMIGINNMKIVKRYVNDNRKYGKFNAIFEVDTITFRNVMSAGKLFIGYEVCRVLESYGIMRCFKCCGFNHTQNNCQSDVIVCPNCAGSHKKDECTVSLENFKCVNCTTYKEKRGLNLNTGHNAYSFKCPVYQHQIELKMDKISYE